MRTLSILSLLALFASPLHAQDVEDLRQQFRLGIPEESSEESWTIPAMGANTPSGFGASFGDVYFGAAATTRARFVEDADGTVAGGFGLGDPWSWVGLEVTVNSFSTLRSGFGERMGVDFHLHRMLPGAVGVAIGWENAITRGGPDSGESRYAVASKWFQLRESDLDPFSALMLSLGAGDGRFRSQEDFDEGADTINIFGSVAVRAFAPVSLVANWTGQDLTLASSISPLRRWPLIVLLGVADVTGNAGDGARLVGSASYSFDFRNP